MKTNIRQRIFAFGMATSSALALMALHPEWRPKPAISPLAVETQRPAETIALNAAAQPVEPAPLVPAASAKTSSAESDADRSSEALERSVESIALVDLPAKLDALVAETNSESVEMSLLLVRRWAEGNPEAAAAWVLQHRDSPGSRAAVEQVAIAWANTNLTAAASWVRALPDGDTKQRATLSLGFEAARTQPMAALEFATELSPTRERDDLLVHAVSQWAGIDARAALTWTLDVPDPALQQRLMASVAIALTEQDAEAAAVLVAEGLAVGEEQDRAAVSIVQRWAQQSPKNTAAWVAQFPDNSSRTAAVQNLVAIWVSQDREAAIEWLRELPAGSLQDAGITAAAQAAESSEPLPQ